MAHQKIINAIADAYLADTRTRLLHSVNWLEKHTESPIEVILGLRLLVLLRSGDGLNLAFNKWDDIGAQLLRDSLIYNATNLAIVPQFNIGRYRIDFVVVYGIDGSLKKVAIECDGHEFHERTKEQARRDRSRDRFLQSQNIPVFRFTGSEIFGNAPDLLETLGQINGWGGANDAA